MCFYLVENDLTRNKVLQRKIRKTSDCDTSHQIIFAMDFLSLESALLLQGGTPYFGYGWSDPSSSGTTTDDGTVDGGSIYGPSNVGSSRGVGVAGGDYYSHGVGYGSDNHVAKLQTPLDPLLKELKGSMHLLQDHRMY